MSFFDISEKKIKTEKDNEYSHVGPADYDNKYKKIITNQHESYAPFGSLSRRHRKNQDLKIGPGSYDIPSLIVKPPIIRYQNKGIIILKRNGLGSCNFDSKSNRFKIQSLGSIGPGSYHINQAKRVYRSLSTSKKPKIIEKIKQINHENYQRKLPTIVDDPIVHHQSESLIRRQKIKGILRWKLDQKQRFHTIKKQSLILNKKPEKILNNSNKEIRQKPTSSFASRSLKSHLDAQIFKTNNPFKASLRQIMKFKDDQPGPGSYDPFKSQGKQINKKYPFFNSRLQRFQKVQQQKLGPGYYNIEQQNSYKIKKQKEIRYTQQSRDSYILKNSLSPGPGTYSLSKKLIKKSFSQKESNGSFGSYQPRFSQQKSLQKSQNNQNNIKFIFEGNENKQKQIKTPQKHIIKLPSSVFSSNTKRFDKSPFDQQFQYYDKSQEDINTRLLKQRQIINQLQSCQAYRPPFLSSDERFKQKNCDESIHKNCWCQVKSVEKQYIPHQSAVFISNEKRIATFDNSPRAPPVGYYKNPKQSIIKQSFNSRFIKRNNNKLKKTLIIQNNLHNKPLPKLQCIHLLHQKLHSYT